MMEQPPATPIFPRQHNEKSPLQQHVVSYNPIIHTLCPVTRKPRAEWLGAFLAVERMTGIEPA